MPRMKACSNPVSRSGGAVEVSRRRALRKLIVAVCGSLLVFVAPLFLWPDPEADLAQHIEVMLALLVIAIIVALLLRWACSRHHHREFETTPLANFGSAVIEVWS